MRKFAIAAFAVATVAIIAGAAVAEGPGGPAAPAVPPPAPSAIQVQVFGELAGARGVILHQPSSFGTTAHQNRGAALPSR